MVSRAAYLCVLLLADCIQSNSVDCKAAPNSVRLPAHHLVLDHCIRGQEAIVEVVQFGCNRHKP